jgi:hypothetical protein
MAKYDTETNMIDDKETETWPDAMLETIKTWGADNVARDLWMFSDDYRVAIQAWKRRMFEQEKK